MKSGSGIALTKEAIDSYLQYVSEAGCTPGTVSNYQRSLKKLYKWLPEGKTIQKGTVERYREELAKRYGPSTVNCLIVPVNRLLEYLGCRQYQVVNQLPVQNTVKPELTRNEYLRLLSAAKMQKNERLYLLIKIFATMGIAVQEVPSVTVEAVQQGKVITYPNRCRKALRIPPCVQQELLDYVRKQGIQSGPVFITRNGTEINRTGITAMIQRLSKDAMVDEKKCNPRCLQKLYDQTQATLQANVEVMLRMTYDNLLEEEQVNYGWKDVQQYL